MVAEISNSKEVIKNRMVRHALTYWDIKNPGDLDPVVKLMLEALSSELHRMSSEIKDTQARILEKIAGLLSPDFLTTPDPAHGILHAVPVEPVELLPQTTSFSTQRNIPSSQPGSPGTVVDIFFTPVDAVQLTDVQVKYLVTGGGMFSYNAGTGKQLTVRSRSRMAENNTLWLGLKLNPEIENIENLFFCFDWNNLEPRLAHPLYQLLPLSKWYVGDAGIEVHPGMKYHVEQKEQKDIFENIFLEYDLLRMKEKDIKDYYDNRFVTIINSGVENVHALTQAYPPSFKNVFSDNELQKLTEKLLWIKIAFPAAMQQEFLDEVIVYTNAFPVMNRQVSDLKYRLRGSSNIIPLKTSGMDQFLAVKSLTDGANIYSSVPYRKMAQEQAGTYTLRNGGVERFDERNARELITYLLELLRSESTAFSVYGYDFLVTTLREMSQKISLIEQKTQGYFNAEIPHYIIVKPFEGNDTMYAEYWTTLAELANNLRDGTRLELVKGARVKQDSLILVTTTTGGKNRLKPGERLNAFRYGIMTRDRIITREDIRNFCFHELGERISAVEIKRGYEMGNGPKESFRRTIDVMLAPAGRNTLRDSEWQVLCEQLRSKLQSRSGLSNYYRILVKSEQAV